MQIGFIYWHPIIYRYIMNLLYGRYFYSRYETISNFLPEYATVVDVCCGDCYINNFLKKKWVDYLGLDLNYKFVKYATKKGIKARLFNIKEHPIPHAQYIIMQGSLYQFIPTHRVIMDKLFSAADKAVIISEPIRNLASSRNSIISFLANLSTTINENIFSYRFTKNELLDLFYEYNASSIKEIAGGKDLIGFFIKDRSAR